MQPLAIELRLFTDIGSAGLRLNPGRGLMARVMAADGTGRGVINIAGAVIEAQLPRHIRAGDQVRLVVRHLDEQRVVLELAHANASAPQADTQPPPGAVTLPGGGQLRTNPETGHDTSPDATRSGAQTVALRYDAPALGALDLRFELDAGGLRVHVAAAPGAAFAAAQAGADALRQTLAESGERAVSVTVSARRQPLDVYA
jgi:Flagellar hook-length control protein FliK